MNRKKIVMLGLGVLCLGDNMSWAMEPVKNKIVNAIEKGILDMAKDKRLLRILKAKDGSKFNSMVEALRKEQFGQKLVDSLMSQSEDIFKALGDLDKNRSYPGWFLADRERAAMLVVLMTGSMKGKKAPITSDDYYLLTSFFKLLFLLKGGLLAYILDESQHSDLAESVLKVLNGSRIEQVKTLEILKQKLQGNALVLIKPLLGVNTMIEDEEYLIKWWNELGAKIAVEAAKK